MTEQKQKAIIFDCDDILLDHVGGFAKFARKHYNIKAEGLPVQYNLQEWLGCDEADVMKMLKHFNEQAYEFGLLEPVDASTVDSMKVLRKLFPEIKFIIVTKSGTMGHSTVLRHVNLANVFGDDMFDEVIILEYFNSKRATYNRLNNKYNIITVLDDHLANIDQAIEIGLDSVVLECSHNRAQKFNPKYNFVSDWDEMFYYLLDKINADTVLVE